MMTLKEIVTATNERRNIWSNFAEEYDKLFAVVDEAILRANVENDKVATLTFEVNEENGENWLIDGYGAEHYETTYEDFDELVDKIIKYLIFNGFKSEDIHVRSNYMLITLS